MMKNIGRILVSLILSIILMTTPAFAPLTEAQAAEAIIESAVSESTNAVEENQNYGIIEASEPGEVSNNGLISNSEAVDNIIEFVKSNGKKAPATETYEYFYDAGDYRIVISYGGSDFKFSLVIPYDSQRSTCGVMYYDIDTNSIRGISVQLAGEDSYKSGYNDSVDIASITKDTVFDFASQTGANHKKLNNTDKANCNRIMQSAFSFWNNFLRSNVSCQLSDIGFISYVNNDTPTLPKIEESGEEEDDDNPTGKCGAECTWTLDKETGTLTISGTSVIYDSNPSYYPSDTNWCDDYKNDYKDQIKTVIIEEGVTGIGHYAFYNCKNLKSITIPDSATFIGPYAFQDCRSLKSINIPYGVTDIGNHVFSSCISLQSISIPDSVTNIGTYAFYACSSLQRITLPNSVTNIESCAFYSCENMTSIIIPDSVKNIEDNAFRFCTKLKSITLPSKLKKIKESTFNSCTALSNVTIPESVTSIDDYAFNGCTNLASIELPNGMKSIGYKVFSFSGITNITIPNTMKDISMNAFENCQQLKNVFYSGSEEEWGKIDIGDNNDALINANIHYNSTAPGLETVAIVQQGESAHVEVTRKLKLTYKITPEDYIAKSVLWETSNAGIASVDATTGVVTGESVGTAVITLTLDGKTAQTTVTVGDVTNPIRYLDIENSNLYLGVGEKGSIGIIAEGYDRSMPVTDPITCESSNTSVAEVDDLGNVTAISNGRTTITVKCKDKKASCTAIVIDRLSDVSISIKDVKLTRGESITLTARALPGDVSVAFSWTSDDGGKTITLQPSENGRSARITGITTGTAKITVTATESMNPDKVIVKSTEASIQVKDSDLSNQTISENELQTIAEELSKDATHQLWITGLDKSYPYTGSAIEPDVAVYYGTTRLVKGKDYAVKYKNNKAATTDATPSDKLPKIIITGKGNFTGSKESTFAITKKPSEGTKSIKKAKVTGIVSMPYTGHPVTQPSLIVTLNGTKIEQQETDGTVNYTVTYSNNIDAGTASVFINGVGKYKDSVKKTFKITSVDLSKCEKNLKISVPDTVPYVANGAKPEPEVTWTSPEGITWTLHNGIDYKVSYKNNKTPSTSSKAGIYITGMGNYAKKSEVANFSIEKGDLAELTMGVADIQYSPNKKGSYYQSKIKIYDLDGKVLNSKNYSLSYYNKTKNMPIDKNTGAGYFSEDAEITVKATGKGNYAGSELTGTYHIRKTVYDINSQKANRVKVYNIPDQIYTGNEIIPEYLDLSQGMDYLKEGKDYEVVSYFNNVKKGTASILLKGKGKYSGTRIVKFKIVKPKTDAAWKGCWNGTSFE